MELDGRQGDAGGLFHESNQFHPAPRDFGPFSPPMITKSILRMRFFTLLFLVVAANTNAHARLGDTEAKIVEQYGKPIETYRDVKGRIGHIHNFDGYIISVEYIDGISQSEVYARRNDAPLTEAQLQQILSANAAGEKWEEISQEVLLKAAGPGWRGWVIRRSKAMSAYGPSIINNSPFKHAISVGTSAYNDQNNALNNESEAIPRRSQRDTSHAPPSANPARPSDGFLILNVLVNCIIEFNLDRVSSSKPVTEGTDIQRYMQHSLNHNVALKHCQTARAILQPLLQIQNQQLRASLQKLDSSFATKERLHKEMLAMIDRITSGTGSARMSEIGKGGADAIEALDQLTSATTELFVALLPLLSAEERVGLASRISSQFPDEQKIYDAGRAEGVLAQEVWLVLKLRDAALGHQK